MRTLRSRLVFGIIAAGAMVMLAADTASAQNYAIPATTVVPITYVVPSPLTNAIVVPAASATTTAVQVQVIPVPVSQPVYTVAETALRIIDVYKGPARQAGLQSGDVIMTVDGKRIRTFEDLRTALTVGKNKVSVDYYNPGTGNRMNRDVIVQDGSIGISVLPIFVTLRN